MFAEQIHTLESAPDGLIGRGEGEAIMHLIIESFTVSNGPAIENI